VEATILEASGGRTGSRRGGGGGLEGDVGRGEQGEPAAEGGIGEAAVEEGAREMGDRGEP
jgi:hypothetical protein